MLEEERAKLLLQQYYGIEALEAKLVHGYDDKNFIVKAKVEESEEWLLFKMIKEVDDFGDGIVEELSLILSQLSCHNLPVPRPNLTLRRSFVQKVDLDSEIKVESYVLQLLTFLPGQILERVKVSSTQLNRLAYQSGVIFAKIDTSLMVVPHKCSLERTNYRWNIGNTNFCKSCFQYIDDIDLREICIRIDEAFDKMIKESPESLRKSLIHGDANEANIVIAKDTTEAVKENFHNKAEWKLTGIIDFSDMMYGPLVFEVATLMAYMMNKAYNSGIEPTKPAAHALRGYQDVLPLIEPEIKALYYCIMKRIVASVCAANRSAKRGENKEKLKDKESMENIARILWKQGEEVTMQQWK